MSKSVKVFGGMEKFIFQYIGHSKLIYLEQYELTLSCQFHLSSFPFDSHKCRIEFGDLWDETKKLKLSPAIAQYRGHPDIKPEDDPTIITDLPYPYKFQLESLPAFEVDLKGGYVYSFTGALLTLERKSIGSLLVGYY